MRRSHLLVGLGFWSLFLAWLAAPADGRACATVSQFGPLPRIDDEHALVVWDSASHVEDFVRTASFDADVERFGFVVPTPTPPTLSEVEPETLAETGRLLERRVLRPRYVFWRGGDYTVKARVSGGVRELVHANVAGMDATVLTASDGEAMSEWLASHGFEMRPALDRWVASYVARGYAFTAFVYVRPPDATTVRPRAVRLRFTTDRPFYPYAEPDDATPSERRPFRLTVLTDQPMRAVIGARTIDGEGLIRRHIDDDTLREDGYPDYWTAQFAFEGRARSTWATIFRENPSVRGADDLFFEPDPNGDDNTPEVIIRASHTTYIPLDCFSVVAVVAGLVTLVWRGRAARARGQ